MKKVVITGMGCISPIGNDVHTAWDNAINAKHGIGRITKFDASDMKVSIAAEVKDFDPLQYMQRNDARRTDLYAQYAIAASIQAMQQSGLDGNIASDRLGVYIGSGIGGIETFIAETAKMIDRGPGRISPFFVPMIISNMAGALVAMKYSASGPNLPVVTACATSNHAIGEAFRAIKHGYADAIITGGADACINPLAIGGFANAMALATTDNTDRASIPFDVDRQGFVIAEGAAVLVLEEYEHALNRGADILAEISGYGNTCDAYHMTAPHPEAIASSRMISLAIQESNRQLNEATYINMHGTSTPLNDKTETLAVKKALASLAHNIALSSTKSVTGHMLGAAGAMEAIMCIQALRNQLIPPTAGYINPDPDCDLNYTPNKARSYNIETALSLSLGFGGHNAALLFNRV